MTVKVHQLSLPEGRDITEKHLVPESQVLLEEDGQDFPVTVMSCLKKSRKRVQQPLSESSEEEVEEEVPVLPVKKKASITVGDAEEDTEQAYHIGTVRSNYTYMLSCLTSRTI